MQHSLNILIADDHRMFAETMKLLFERSGNVAKVDIVVNGREAIDKCLSAEFDLVVLDISMPLIDGIEALKEIRRHKPEQKVLMVTMLTEYEKARQALEAGARGVVSKKSDTEELLKAIKSILNNELVIPAILTGTGHGKYSRKGRVQQAAIFSDNVISPRERDILKLITEGLTDSEIASTLSIAPMTAKTHRKNLLAKLNLRNTAQLVRFAVENKLV